MDEQARRSVSAHTRRYSDLLPANREGMCCLGYNMRYNAPPGLEMAVPAGMEVRMNVLKVTTVGNSVGVILPKEILERLRVGKGDSLYIVETKNGIQLTAYDPAFAEQVEAAERVMREDRDALKKLAE